MSKNRFFYLFGILYLLFSLFCVFQLRFYFTNNALLFLLIVNICILTDTGGYIFGKIFKGPKLTKYSPNKTYSGLLGSFILSYSIIPLNYFFSFVSETSIINLVFFTFIVSGTSQIGDIIISYFKRASKIKDTGNIIPGHGGLLDRIDGMLFAFPISYLMILFNFFEYL
ncbi:phosphatidate cytidylyltransferase [Candidatus Pelagibacter sp.]|uniref:phosphatidate cytidylyltransferase n=1 Tax=Candidatus Pelagibacter sp. TaxID=2024849 RepID=UPI003F86AA3B